MEPEKPITSDPLANVLSYLDRDQSEPADRPAPSSPLEADAAVEAPRRSRLRRFRRWRMARQASRTKRAIDALSVPPWQKRRLWPLGLLETVLGTLILLSGLTLVGTIIPWSGHDRLISTLASLSGDNLYRDAEPRETPTPGRVAEAPPVEPAETVAAIPVVKPKPVTPPVSLKPRVVALVVRGAPKPPAGEVDLRRRVASLEHFVKTQPKPTNAAVSHWLRQHAWVVTGAKWGWLGGEQALVQLIAVDRQVRAQWGIGARSENRARYALRQLRYMQANPQTRSTHWLESYALTR